MPEPTVQYPASLDTATTLLSAVNVFQAKTTLGVALGVADTSATVVATSGFPASGYLVLDTEIVYYTSINATQFLGLIRGADGTAAGTHPVTTVVKQPINAANHNLLRQGILAIQTELGILPKGTYATVAARLTDAVTITATHSANLILASPDGSAGASSFRALVNNDLPTVGLTKGGTGQITANLSLNALLPVQTAQTGKALITDGTNTSWQPVGLGSVTSVALATNAGWFTVTGSPVTTTGTLTFNLTSALTANQVLATPNGATGVVGLRALVNADLPVTGVTAGSYTSANITVNAQGVISVAANGSGGGITGSGTTGTLAKFTGATAVGDSILVETSLTLTATGKFTASGVNNATISSVCTNSTNAAAKFVATGATQSAYLGACDGSSKPSGVANWEGFVGCSGNLWVVGGDVAQGYFSASGYTGIAGKTFAVGGSITGGDIISGTGGKLGIRGAADTTILSNCDNSTNGNARFRALGGGGGDIYINAADGTSRPYTGAGVETWATFLYSVSTRLWMGGSGVVTMFLNGSGLNILDGYDIILDTTTGTKIGTATSQKLGLWGKTPIVQPAGALQAAITNSTGGTQDGTLVDVATAGIADPAKINDNFTDLYALVDAIRTAKVNFGSMKGAA